MFSYPRIVAFLLMLSAAPASAAAADMQRIEHIIVISLENHSFDNLFGHFPGADGLDNAHKTATQTDADGTAYTHLPIVMDTRQIPPQPDVRFPADLPNKPFAIEPYAPIGEKTGDLVHRFFQQQAQINGGRMDRFAQVSDAGGLAMGYYDGSSLGLWRYAQEFTLADHFFHGAFGGSFLNHFWLVCACAPTFKNAPDDLVKRDMVTDDGYAVNTLFSISTPRPLALSDMSKLLPLQDMPTIGDRLSDKGISWAWYAGGWNDALAGHPARWFQFHHQPFAYFKNFAEGTAAREQHLKDESDFLEALKDGTLPAVAFYKPLGEFNLHPGYGDVESGDQHITRILQAIENSPVWESTVVIVTFDENGGYWDHVPPPAGDRWGPGVRVPTLIISPLAKKHFVDHTVYDTTSILRFIEKRFGLEPLGTRKANDLSNALL